MPVRGRRLPVLNAHLQMVLPVFYPATEQLSWVDGSLHIQTSTTWSAMVGEARVGQLSGQRHARVPYSVYLKARDKCREIDIPEFKIRLYNGLYDAISRGERDGHEVGGRIILPMSFTGGPRYMHAYYLDALAICRKLGNPQFFITFTCNVNWTEIKR
nr:DNA helicase [Tanacetum cinerariifolium]